MRESSVKASRMERRHGRLRRRPGFNMISLMDIFTILVFFLLVNSSEVQTQGSTKTIRLPESIAEQKPRETLVVQVSRDEIILQGERVVGLDQVLEQGDTVIEPLRLALEEHKQLQLGQRQDPEESSEISIAGDREIPFRVLKKIMVTCTRAGFGRISLSVTQKATPG